MSTLRLRAAAPYDHDGVVALLGAAGLPLAGVPPALDGFLVAERGAELAGVAGLERYGDVGLLRSVAVSPAERGTGVGRALVERVLSDARKAGVGSVFLLTTTADRWFPRLGFSPVDRTALPDALGASEELRGACPASAVAMHRSLVGTEPLRVLILCTGNSARSQIAEAVLNARGAGRFRADSAGARPAARVHPLAVEVLRDAGIEWHGHAPRSVDDFGAREWDLVITVCDHAREACPILPGHPALAHWGMPDPATVEGSDTERRRAFTETLALVNRHIDALLALPTEALDPATLAERVSEIGRIAAAR
jgi:protein-tyrosine-phosphatase/N-acetylglutamate synthase-like GNAT family acetyltransferase